MHNYKLWYRLGLAIFIITAIFSVGYHNHDEHFQVLEFANYKMGFSPAGDLPWELEAKIRPALQPFIVWCLGSTLKAANVYNPFALALILRLSMALFYWWAIVRLIKLLLPDFTHQRGKLLFVICSLLLWFVPYTSVRFSAEAFSGMLFCFAAGTILQANEPGTRRQLQLLLAGLLLGFAWFARIQLAFALIGMAIWILFISKWPFRYWVLPVLSFIVAVGVCISIDYWFYGEWLFTPYNYYDVNIVQNIAAHFGVSPWWYYFELFIMNGVPPISVVLLILFFRGVWRQPKHLFTICCLIFFAGHSAVGHKEMRFLFLMVIPFIYVVSMGLDSWLHLPKSKFYTIGFKVLVFMNVGLLIYRGLAPAQEIIKYQQIMYGYAGKGKTTVLCIGESPYQALGLNMNFYRHPNMQVLNSANTDTLTEITAYQTDREIYIFSWHNPDDETIRLHHLELVYSSFPEWLKNFNFNNWAERTRIGVIYKVRK